MNKKGFTLVEMIAVIVILCAIALIAIPQIVKTIDNQKEKLYTEQIYKINEAAEEYVSKNTPTEDSVTILLSDLKKAGFLKNEVIKDPRDDSTIDGVINITWDNDTNRYVVNFVRKYK